MRKQFIRMRMQRTLDLGDRQVAVERRHAVLQKCEFFRNIRRNQVAPGGQHLAELDEDRSQLFQRLAQALAARRGNIAPEHQHIYGARKARRRQAGNRDIVQTITQGHAQDFQRTQKLKNHSASRAFLLRSLSMRLPSLSTSSRSFTTSCAKSDTAAGRTSMGFSSRKYSARFSVILRCVVCAAVLRPLPACTSRCAAISPTSLLKSASASQRTDCATWEMAAANSASPSIFTYENARSRFCAIIGKSASFIRMTTVAASSASGASHKPSRAIRKVSVAAPVSMRTSLPAWAASLACYQGFAASR